MMIARLIQEMVAYDTGEAKRIAHFMKVFAYAQAIGRLEGLAQEAQEVLEAAAVVHDVGIRNSEAKYGSAAGHHQQIEGPPVARDMLTRLGFQKEQVEQVCWLVAHHHTYVDITPGPYQILVEADFLVNLEEGHVSRDGLEKVRREMFRTTDGLGFFDGLFPQPQ